MLQYRNWHSPPLGSRYFFLQLLQAGSNISITTGRLDRPMCPRSCGCFSAGDSTRWRVGGCCLYANLDAM